MQRYSRYDNVDLRTDQNIVEKLKSLAMIKIVKNSNNSTIDRLSIVLSIVSK
jgi:hypothetical protein